MESKIQPILCCVGDSVAGEATQFLMERALAASHCDWRVITVEVPVEKFATALEGMYAMRFTALRFFPGLQRAAAGLLCPQEFLPGLTVEVTSALRVGDKWTCWDNVGQGLLKLFVDHSPLANTIVWMHQDSRLTRSLIAALLSSTHKPAHVLWSDGPTFGKSSTEADVPAGNWPDWISCLPLADAWLKIRAIFESAETAFNLVFVGEQLSTQLELLGQLQVEQASLILATNELLPLNRGSAVWPSGPITILSRSEQITAAEAYDFERWTGKSADVDLLRDAFDEYTDF